MKSRICPYRSHCTDSGTCETCDFGKAFEKLSDKNKKLAEKNKALQKENEKLKERIDTLMNPNFLKGKTNMTDNQIVKALECCKLTNEQQESQCEDCPLWETSLMICQELLAFHALDLIKRQMAEIERVIEQNARLNKECDHYFDFASTAKAKAIKEFAERLKEKRGHDFPFTRTVFVEDIDDLVKEMTEDAKHD